MLLLPLSISKASHGCSLCQTRWSVFFSLCSGSSSTSFSFINLLKLFLSCFSSFGGFKFRWTLSRMRRIGQVFYRATFSPDRAPPPPPVSLRSSPSFLHLFLQALKFIVSYKPSIEGYFKVHPLSLRFLITAIKNAKNIYIFRELIMCYLLDCPWTINKRPFYLLIDYFRCCSLSLGYTCVY